MCRLTFTAAFSSSIFRSLLYFQLGEVRSYNVLNVLEFTSDRKRMGVVVQCPDGVLKLYVKGAVRDLLNIYYIHSHGF